MAQSYTSSCLTLSMRSVGEALKLDSQGKAKEAYCQYLSSMHFIVQSLKDDAWDKELNSLQFEETEKLYKLLQKCLERSRDMFHSNRPDEADSKGTSPDIKHTDCVDNSTSRDRLEDHSKQRLSSGQLFPSPVVKNRRSLSDSSPCRIPMPPPANLNRLIMSLPTPPEIVRRNNNTLRVGVKNFAGRRAAAESNLSALRRTAENMVIQKAKQAAFEKNLQERREFLRQEAERRFATISQRREDNREFKKEVYTKILEFEQGNIWTRELRTSFESNSESSETIKNLVNAVVRCKTHPLGILLAEVQFKIYQMILPLVKGNSVPHYSFDCSSGKIILPGSSESGRCSTTEVVFGDRHLISGSASMDTFNDKWPSTRSGIAQELKSSETEKASNMPTNTSEPNSVDLSMKNDFVILSSSNRDKAIAKDSNFILHSQTTTYPGVVESEPECDKDYKDLEELMMCYDEGSFFDYVGAVESIGEKQEQGFTSSSNALENKDSREDDSNIKEDGTCESHDGGEESTIHGITKAQLPNTHLAEEQSIIDSPEQTHKIPGIEKATRDSLDIPKSSLRAEDDNFHENDYKSDTEKDSDRCTKENLNEATSDMKERVESENKNEEPLPLPKVHRKEAFVSKEALNEIVREVHVGLDLVYSLLLITYKELDQQLNHDSCYSSLEVVFFQPLWPWLTLLFRLYNEDKELLLYDAIKKRQASTLDEYGIREQFQLIHDQGKTETYIPYLDAIQELASLSSFGSPLEKLECAVRSSCKIVKEVEDYWTIEKGSKAPALGCDDLLPILTYIIVKSGQPQLASECHALEEFIHESYLMGEEGYCLTTLQTAIAYLVGQSAKPGESQG